MNIAVIGTGNVGSVLGTRLAEQGHYVTFGTRDPGSTKIHALLSTAGHNVRAATIKEAATAAEVIILAVPYFSAEDALKAMGPLQGKVLIDTTNALKPDFSGLAVRTGESAGENIAGWAPGAKVVKAFNTVGTRVMEDPQFGKDNAIMFIAGDHAGAKAAATELAAALGFAVIDAGPLHMSRHLESMAMLWIRLAFVQGIGTDFGMKILKR
ncbi:MAG: NAD(P)-binding domain-containing protein [Candidatus Omnitrophica bacterium]|nr:NAD(P)-binding domain-containing protein [Candidatus Omnitrophota bacterium]